MNWILPTINAIFVAYLVYAQYAVGRLESISESFYHPKTKRVFKIAMWLMGGLFTFYDGNIETHLAGLACIGVPLFGDFRNSVVRWFHFAFAGAFYMLLGAYISPFVLLGLILGFLVLKAAGLRVYWLEVIGAAILFVLFYLQ